MTRTLSGMTYLVCWVALGLGFSAGCTITPKPEEEQEHDPAAEAEQACEDTADAAASSAQNCGYDYQTNYNAFIQGAGASSCSDFIGVRDIDALYDECIPFLSSLTCAQIDDPGLQLPSACKSQLLR